MEEMQKTEKQRVAALLEPYNDGTNDIIVFANEYIPSLDGHLGGLDKLLSGLSGKSLFKVLTHEFDLHEYTTSPLETLITLDSPKVAALIVNKFLDNGDEGEKAFKTMLKRFQKQHPKEAAHFIRLIEMFNAPELDLPLETRMNVAVAVAKHVRAASTGTAGAGHNKP